MKVFLEVYGCTANKSDASILRGLINRHPDIHITNDITQSAWTIILTCTVIATTEQRMISRIKKINSMGLPIIVSGCMASVQADMLKDLFPDIILVPPQEIHTIIDIIKHKKINSYHQGKEEIIKSFDTLFAPITIAEGCRYQCSYCITSVARGSLRSVPIDMISRDVRHALRQGCKEIQLTAQDTASYGSAISENLGTLLHRIVSIPGSYRIRIGMMNPRSVKNKIDDIINGMNHSRVYKFLHLPVQSGDDDILSQMNRGYTIQDFKTICFSFRHVFPTLSLSTDIIVGFPGETEEQYQRSIELLNTIQPDFINITRYSARPYTKAKIMDSRIPTEVVKDRSRRMSALANQITKTKNISSIGKTYQVLLLEQEKPGSVMGRTDEYKPVVIHEDLPLGIQVLVTIIDATENYLIGILK